MADKPLDLAGAETPISFPITSDNIEEFKRRCRAASDGALLASGFQERDMPVLFAMLDVQRQEIERLREALDKIRVWSMEYHALFAVTMDILHDMVADALGHSERAKDIREEQRKAHLAEVKRNPRGPSTLLRR